MTSRDAVGPLPINPRRASGTLGSLRLSPTANQSLRLSPDGAGKGRTRWADITPTEQVSGVFRPPTSGGFPVRRNSGDMSSTVFPSTPSPWPSMTKYTFGTATTSPPSAPSSFGQSPEALMRVNGAAYPGTTMAPSSNHSSPVGPFVAAAPNTAGCVASIAQQSQVIYMQMPMPMQMPAPAAAPVMMVGGPVAVQYGTLQMVPAPGMSNGISCAAGTPNDEPAPAQGTADALNGDRLHETLQRESSAGRQLFGEALDANTFENQSQGFAVQSGVPNSFAAPSVGSQLHGTGKCNPCAWFWKPNGCHNALNCTYCHLCPEGELKARKKAKVAAIRMGALQPTTSSAAGTSAPPATLKLTTLLSADAPP
mmetsp:Transcript_107146/g.301573  ORF Transcript_107146/g.301573 Transcript_107146/m.301573 type:complete len:367 (-) Transcript_107146:129-1229(-)